MCQYVESKIQPCFYNIDTIFNPLQPTDYHETCDISPGFPKFLMVFSMCTQLQSSAVIYVFVRMTTSVVLNNASRELQFDILDVYIQLIVSGMFCFKECGKICRFSGWLVLVFFF